MSQQLPGNKPRKRILTVLLKAEQNERSSVKISLRGKKGVSLMEILVAIAIIAFTLTILLGLTSFSLGTATLIKQTNQANNIAQETMEVVRNFRDGTNWGTDGLGALTVGIDYYPQKSGSPAKWQLSAGSETINGFTRTVSIEDVQRDANDNIVVSGGTNDPDTKKVTVTVSWEERGRTHQIELITYLTNWRE
ncbi:MAG: prepilin-type N-terminal cleavage/methylation domain-containing protein [Candidatus Paceibacterales bacterium]